jgi:hypothetical protein
MELTESEQVVIMTLRDFRQHVIERTRYVARQEALIFGLGMQVVSSFVLWWLMK